MEMIQPELEANHLEEIVVHRELRLNHLEAAQQHNHLEAHPKTDPLFINATEKVKLKEEIMVHLVNN